jgi:hypothetical protein
MKKFEKKNAFEYRVGVKFKKELLMNILKCNNYFQRNLLFLLDFLSLVKI